jgi:GNAT superfamily N-acetyltransferase
MTEIRVINTRKDHAEQLGEMQRLIFPTLTETELISAEKYRHHVDLFPEGQFVALIDEGGVERVVGATSTLRLAIEQPSDLGQHSFEHIVSENWFTLHNPDGKWLYGADVSVHPDFRRRGIATMLYDARRDLVKRLNLKGEVAGGMLPGYERYKGQYSIEEYVAKVGTGELTDPTVSAQMANGFLVRGVLYNYLTDPRSDNHSALIVRPNEDYTP